MTESLASRVHAQLPPAALVAAMLCILTLCPDQDGFPLGFHGYLSSHGAVITQNLSPEHGWLMFERQYLGPEGDILYKPYSRFPVTSFLILKLFSHPFSSDPGAALQVMHQVMNLFLLAALWTSIRCLRQLGLSSIAATGASLLAFSSFYLLHFGDMIFVDTPTLFGCLLALEGMAIHQTTGRQRPLLLRALLGVLFGWQVFAFLLPYTATLAVRDLLRPGRKLEHLAGSAGIRTGLAALLLGSCLLGANLWNEQRVTGVPFTQLDTLSSAGKRLGVQQEWNERHAKKLSSGRFLVDQVRRVGKATAPAILPPWPSPSLSLVIGSITIVLSLLFALRGPRPLLAWTALLSGFLWALPLKHFVAFHEFQGMYYVGIPLLVYGTLFGLLEHRLPALVTPGMLGALLLFCAGVLHVAQNKSLTSGKARAHTEDFRAMAQLIPKGGLYATTGSHKELRNPSHGVRYYLPGRVVAPPHDAHYLIDPKKARFGDNITPDNRHTFLFLNPRKSGQTESPAYDHPLLIERSREGGEGAH